MRPATAAASPPPEELLASSPTASVRADAAEALARTPTASARRALRAALRDPDRFVREQALQSLIDLHGLRPLLLASDGGENNQSPLGRLLLLIASDRGASWERGAAEAEALLAALDANVRAAVATLEYRPSDDPELPAAFSSALPTDRALALSMLPSMRPHDRAWAEAFIAIQDHRRGPTVSHSPLLRAFLDSLDTPPDPRDRRDSYDGVDFYFRLSADDKRAAAAALIERIILRGDPHAIWSAVELQLQDARDAIAAWRSSEDPAIRDAASRALAQLQQSAQER